MLKFSVILCSRNRSKQVGRCLEKLDLQPFDELGGELILVDSGSTDNTLEIYSQFERQHPEVRCKVIAVREAGLSIARNAGVAASSGTVLVFLDDDVYFGDGYISKVLHRFENGAPELGFVGGRILLFDPTDSKYGCVLKRKYWERKSGRRVRPGEFQGTNFCALRKVYDRVEGFDNELGAGKKYRCEDVDFVARALIAGFSGAYDPDLLVYHHHGRKNGPDTISLDLSNVYAVGAFYAKMCRQQPFAYFVKGFFDWVYISTRRIISIRTKLTSPGKAALAFWAGFRDYSRDFRD